MALAISLMLQGGCATAHSERICLNLRTYSREEQTRAADELDLLGSQSMTGKLMADYATLRDQAKALYGQEKEK